MTITTDARTDFRVRAIPANVLDQLRERDDAGNPPRIRTDQAGGSPLRCCLRPSTPGEEIALVSYAPLRRWARRTGADPGPYDEVGPVFIHSGPCSGPDGTGYPSALAGRPRVLRAYGADGTIRGGRLAGEDELRDPAVAAAVITEVLGDPEVAVIHVRAVDFGCFSFEITRS